MASAACCWCGSAAGVGGAEVDGSGDVEDVAADVRARTFVALVALVVAGPVIGRGSGPWGVTRTSYRGAAEGTGDFVHQGRVRRPGLRLSADGGLQLPTQRQCSDLVDREDGA